VSEEIIASEIAIHDILTSLEPSIIWDACQEIPRSHSLGIRVFEGEKLWYIGIVKRDIPMEELCGPRQELVEERCHPIEDREKETPESIDIRIHDPGNSEIPIEVTRS
jgi:hypothetical protein